MSHLVDIRSVESTNSIQDGVNTIFDDMKCEYRSLQVAPESDAAVIDRALPERHREAVCLQYLMERSYDEIVEQPQVPAGTLRVWLYRKRHGLKREVERMGITGSSLERPEIREGWTPACQRMLRQDDGRAKTREGKGTRVAAESV